LRWGGLVALVLNELEVGDMLGWDHGGGFSLDASVRIESHDRAGLVANLPLPAPMPLTASPSKPLNPEPQPPPTGASRPSPWAALLARIYEAFPLICPACGTALTFIAFLTEPEPITQILAHIGEPTSPPLIHPARGPPQTEFEMGPGSPQAETVAQGSPQDDLNQSPEFDPAEPEAIPLDNFDQSWDG